MSDPLFNDVLYLQHYETDLTSDVVGSDWSIFDHANGTIEQSTSESRYGTGSMYISGPNDSASQLYQDPVALDFSQAFTIEVSVNLDNLSGARGIFMHGQGDNADRFQMYVNTSGELDCYAATGGTTLLDSPATTVGAGITPGTWADLAVGFDGVDTLHLYVDGTAYGPYTGFAEYVPSFHVFRWGWARVSDSNVVTNGYLDETRITQADRYGGVAYTPAEFPDFGDVVPPTITTQPVDTSTPVGGHAYFFCEATGTTGILYYQWYRVPGTILLGQKGQYLDFYNTPDRLDGEQYYCIATDDGGSVTSDTATLTVISETLQITSQPSSVSVTVGQGVSFSVVAADATGTINYQWKDNGANVGTNASIYTIASTVTLDNGSIITVDVSDDLSTVTSDDALLTVFTPPPYPPGFPCPTWQYSNQTTGFQRRTPFDSGWTRQRRQFGLTGTSVNLSFKVSTEGFADFNEWISANGFEWFDIDLDRYGEDWVTQTMRFVSAIQYSYSNFDVIYATVTGEFKND